MRTRSEIEQTFSTVTVPAGSEGYANLLLEILLDIRDLLSAEKDERQLDMVTKDRMRAEQERLSKVRLQVENT